MKGAERKRRGGVGGGRRGKASTGKGIKSRPAERCGEG